MHTWIVLYRINKFSRWRKMEIADQVAESKHQRPSSQIRYVYTYTPAKDE